MPDISSLYHAPPAPSGGNALTSDPMRVLSIIPAMRQLEFMPLQKKQLEQTIESQKLHMQGQQISNTQAQTNLQAGWDQTLNDRLGTLANLD